MEFQTAEELKRHYARLRAETYRPRKVAPMERPNVIDVATRAFDPAALRPAPPPPAPTAPLVRDVLRLSTRDIIFPGGPKSRAQAIRRDVANAHGVTLAEMDSPRHDRRYVAPRFEAIARIYVECPELSLPVIGQMFGGRDHTTILSAVKKMGVYFQGRRPASGS